MKLEISTISKNFIKNKSENDAHAFRRGLLFVIFDEVGSREPQVSDIGISKAPRFFYAHTSLRFHVLGACISPIFMVRGKGDAGCMLWYAGNHVFTNLKNTKTKMKKTFLYSICIVSACLLALSGCKSTKNVSASVGAVEVPQNICETLAQEKPATRAYGKGVHFDEMTAKNIAAAQARRDFANAIAAKIKTATAGDAAGYSLYSGDSNSGNSVSDQGSKNNDSFESIAEEIVSNTAIIKSVKFILPNKQYEYWVCLEYMEGISQMATEITKRVEQRISDEDKMKMNFEFEQFRQRMENELEKMR